RGQAPRGTPDPGRTGQSAPADPRRAPDVAGSMTASMTAGLAQEVAAAVDQLRQITVQVRTHRAATGAGILWNGGESEGRGLVITNAHVVQGDRATIELSEGTAARGGVVARDLKGDLAALELATSGPVVGARVRDPPPLGVGEPVIAIGHPGGGTGAATLGIIHRAASEPEGRTRRWIVPNYGA